MGSLVGGGGEDRKNMITAAIKSGVLNLKACLLSGLLQSLKHVLISQLGFYRGREGRHLAGEYVHPMRGAITHLSGPALSAVGAATPGQALFHQTLGTGRTQEYDITNVRVYRGFK